MAPVGVVSCQVVVAKEAISPAVGVRDAARAGVSMRAATPWWKAAQTHLPGAPAYPTP